MSVIFSFLIFAHIFFVLNAMAKKAKEIHNSVKKGTPFASVRLKMLWNYYDNPKKEADIAYFCAFCAIKSILGDKGYTKTNKNLIIARMFGLVDIKSEEA